VVEFAGHEPVQAVLRALSLLTAFNGDEVYLSLGELARRVRLPKPTVLRMARTLSISRFLVGREDGAWRLGPATGYVGSRYQAQFDLDSRIEPVLRELSATTGETSSFFVYEENIRSCLMRCEGPQGNLHHVRLGEVLPLNRGSAGRVIVAALGEPGMPYEEIRRKGFYITRAEHTANTASVSAAVRGKHGAVFGAVSTSGPLQRLTEEMLQSYAEPTMNAAKELGMAFGAMPATSLKANWFPD
jgi:DNA-binding IclR family transcriptional regulator